jgi:broad specificity phosphatase PhoE
MQVKINIQSFGDIITNSSSEVYCIYDRRGTEQIEKAIKEIVRALNPEINLDDHLEISLVPNPDRDIYEGRNPIPMDEFYNREFGKWAEDKENEEVLKDFPKWLKQFQDEYCTDNDGCPNFELSMTPLTEIGKVLAISINKILNAFDHIEIYDG